ncbi:MAG: acyltransferase [Desulfuromonadales bacterium]|nr:acyltransferase [Desulfuromonadales bacterium]
MGYLSERQIAALGFKSIGKGVKISDRAAIYNHDQIEIGDYSRIDDFCVLSGKIIIGRNVHIAIFCNIAGGSEGAKFDDFSGLSYGCHVITQSDDYTGRTMTNPTVPGKYKKECKKPVYIGRHCIVGTNSLILPGVTLQEGTSVGAMSMVTKTTDPWSVYFGIPAKRLKARKQDLLVLEKQYLEEAP